MWRYAENIFREPLLGYGPQAGQGQGGQPGHDLTHFKTIQLMAGDTPVQLFLWDWPTGSEHYRPIPAVFLREKSAVLVVIDVTNPSCLEDVDHWLSMMKAECIPTKLLLGNKIDADRQVSHAEAEAFATTRGLHYFETSAKDGTGVVEAIDFAVFDALEKSKPRRQ
eukprot:s23_g31.t1